MRVTLLVSLSCFVFIVGCGDDDVADVGVADMQVQPTSCGTTMCGEGLVCCNASCGICVLPTESCTKLMCADVGPPDATVDADAITSATDRDGDGVVNEEDNCPDVANTEQRDFDGDLTGDPCDSDADGDGVDDVVAPGFLSRAQVLDYFGQDVCVDAAGDLTSMDPATCVVSGMRIRNHRPNEPLPYVLFEGADTAANSSRTYFLRNDKNEPVAVARRERSPHLERNFSMNGLPQGLAQVYNLSGPYISLVYTESEFGRQHLFGEGCNQEQAWNLVEIDGVSGTPGLVEGSAGVSFTNDCQTLISSTYQSEWEIRDEAYGDRTLRTLYVKANLQMDGQGSTYREYFFTREYGLTREAYWRPGIRAAASNCPGSGQDMEGFGRGFCTETATVFPVPGFHNVRIETVALTKSNKLQNGDFGKGDTSSFTVFVDRNITLSTSVTSQGWLDGNHFLSAQWSGDGAASFFQDIEADTLKVGERYEFGAYLWANAEVNGRLVIHQLSANGILETANIPLALTSTPTLFESNLVLRDDAIRLRFEMYLQNANVGYAMDSAFVIEATE